KTLRKAGLVSIEKGTKKYSITELGKILVEFSRDLEEYIAVKRGRMFVRTSRMTIDEFDRTRIARSLVGEAGMPQTLADEVAAEAEDRLLKFGIVYLSAPLIRELVNTILIERKLEEYRHKLTRLGLPVNDVTVLLREAGQKHLDANWVQKSAGEKVTEEYVLLNSLPRTLHQRTPTSTRPRRDQTAHLPPQLGRLLQHNPGPSNNRARPSNPESPAESRSCRSKRKRRRNLRRLFKRSRRAIHNNNRCKSRNLPSAAHPQSIRHCTDPQREDRDHGRASRPQIGRAHV